MITSNDAQSDARKAEIIDITCYDAYPLGWDHLLLWLGCGLAATGPSVGSLILNLAM